MVAFDKKIAESAIPSIYARMIIDTLEESGDVNTLMLLEEHCPWLSSSIENMTDINAARFIRLVEILSEQTYNANLGLEIGKKLPPNSHGLLGNLIVSAPTLQIALESILEFYAICVPYVKGSVDIEGQGLVVNVSCNILIPENVFRFLADMMFGTFDEMIRFFTGKSKNIASISLISEIPPRANYRQILGADLQLGQPEYQAVIPLQITQLTSPLACPELFREYALKCLNRTISSGQRHTFVNKIKEIINKDIAHNWTLEELSQQLNVSISTLQRKLQNEGSSYREIISTVKFNSAKNKLATTIESIDDIAHSLGYANTSNFYAAFKRRENTSPSKYREKAKQG